jgi:hypothetical protein
VGKAEECDKPESMRRCVRCKAIYYCSKECQIKDWTKGGFTSTAPFTHKVICPLYRQDNELFYEKDPNGAKVREIFPWALEHHESGAFFRQEMLCRRGLYGKVGFWAQPETFSPHLNGDDAKGWCNGQLLLEESLPSLEEGWVNLQDCEIPSGPAVNGDLVSSWAEYAQRRNLAGSSIAPLLLTNVLTICHMILHKLLLGKTKSPCNGEYFIVYVLGAESELNSLPLLEELAYLLPPEMDVHLKYLSPAVKHLVDKAAQKFPNSYIMNCGEYVVDKSVAEGGRVRVSLERQHALYHDVSNFAVVDAVVALNAGIGTYLDWAFTMCKLHAFQTPFCVSEYTAHSLRFARDVSIPHFIERFNMAMSKAPDLPPPCKSQYDIELNPFHGIVGRDQAAALVPNLLNGYILTWKPSL